MITEAFNGEFYPKVDSKARVSIPAPFRRILELGDPATADRPRSRVYMVYGGTNRKFVECYTMEQSRELFNRVMQMDFGSRERLVATRTFLTLVSTVDIDEDGRIVLPQPVREKLDLSPADLATGLEAAFSGAGENFQIWKRRVYKVDVQDKLQAMDEDLLGGLDPSVLFSGKKLGA